MQDHAIIFAIRRILFGIVMLALVFAPLQIAAPALANVGLAQPEMAAMATSDCPQKMNCCDEQKSNCPSPQSCAVQNAGNLTPVLLAEVNLLTFGPAALAAPIFAWPDSQAPLPLRRPPRS